MNDEEQHLQAMIAHGQRHQNKPEREAPPFLSDEEIALLKRTLLSKFPEDQQLLFIRRCQRARLDPFSGQIHPTLRNTKVRGEGGEVRYEARLVCVTGVYGLLAVATRTGEYDGCEIAWSGKDGKWRDEWLADEFPMAAKCIVYHKGRSHPEVAIARWDSFVQQSWDKESKSWIISEFWNRLSDFMLSKCARAAALRGAFPDQLSEIYIREELPGLESEQVPAMEEKVAASQERDKKVTEELKAAGVKVVESTGPAQPTPEQALEPAFEEDKKPAAQPHKTAKRVKEPAEVATQVFAEKLTEQLQAVKAGQTLGEKIAAAYPQAKPVTLEPIPEPAAQAEDNLDLSPAAAGEDTTAIGTSSAEPPKEPPWKNHVIKGVRHVKFQGRKIGDLAPAELAIIENQWLPAIREDWNNASEEQQADAPMFESAIAYYKMAKPW